MIAIVDYGLGNVSAILNVYKRLNVKAFIANSKEELIKAQKIVLPGVGGFDQAMYLLGNSGMKEVLNELVLEKEIPVLGVCVGMQIMAQSSDEGSSPGLNWIKGEVKSLKTKLIPERLALPHMGWNEVSIKSKDELFTGFEERPQFYFLHNYHFVCADEYTSIATADYGIDISCIVKSKNIYGVQFHPEKSHHNGVSLLKNFSELNFA